MEFTRCFRCMEKTNTYPCPSCGYDARGNRPKEYALLPGTILNGKYVVGDMLGQGGFGITYIGWDLVLENKVAIKEYFPSGQVGRSGTSGTLQWYSTPQAENARNSGMEMFLKEARKMSRVREIPQVVHIRDLFQQNDTAYIVMDFVEGETLMARLKKTGPLNWNQARGIFLPTIRAMAQVHGEGLIHRDLSPDNLMLLPDGSVKILDLGAAKDLNVNSGASSMQVAKGGFSPLEQYTQRGGSGSWSDVYAMAATIYFSLTDVLPPPAMDRVVDDQLRWDLASLKALPGPVLEALKKAMILMPKNRTQTMGEFLEQLEKAEPKPSPSPAPKPAPEKKTWSPLLPIAAAALAVVLLFGGLLRGPTKIKQYSPSVKETYTTPTTEAPEPTEAKVIFPLSIPKPQTTFPLSIQEQTIDAASRLTVAIRSDGTVVATGQNSWGQCDVSGWTDIVAVAAGHFHTVGLKADGTVVATGNNEDNQCNVSKWVDIVAVAAGRYFTIGLKSDGTVVATGKQTNGQCDVSDWKDIVAITTGDDHTVGLKADGTVVATGDSADDRCKVSGWTDIVAISAGYRHTVGWKADGTIVVTGNNTHGQCDVSGWTDIVAVAAGGARTIGLKANGTAVATGWNPNSECDVSDWTDIVTVIAGNSHTIGLKADGTMVATGESESGECDVSDWTNIRIPKTASGLQ